MARAYRGPYARPSSVPVPYATAAVWGTGINSVHYLYGEGPPLRTLGRAGAIGASPVAGESPRDRPYQQPTDHAGYNPPEILTWGYPVDYSVGSFGGGTDSSPETTAPGFREDMDDRPNWSQDTPDERTRTHNTNPSWGRTGARLRSRMGGARRRRITPSYGNLRPSTQLPNETVSEGWINKATSYTAYAHPSDPSQYEVQTSMRQRFGTRVNDRATARGTDEPRAKIASRVEPMVEKVYSQGERLYDMFPYQADVIERPFRYRTAATGPASWMEPNAYQLIEPYQRTPPPDPSEGIPEVSYPSGDYGYTPEDTMYYG